MHPKDAEGIANSVDPDHTAPSDSALFAQTCLSENLGTLRYQQTCQLLIVMQKVILQKRMCRRQVGPEVCLRMKLLQVSVDEQARMSLRCSPI